MMYVSVASKEDERTNAQKKMVFISAASKEDKGTNAQKKTENVPHDAEHSGERF